MDCPRCHTPLVIVEYLSIELDWCPACEGLWFNRGEMELLARKLGRDTEPIPACNAASCSEKPLKCPECNKTMNKRLMGEGLSVVADVCRICGGLWLDHGELEELLGPGNADTGSNPIQQHLRQTFSAETG